MKRYPTTYTGSLNIRTWILLFNVLWLMQPLLSYPQDMFMIIDIVFAYFYLPCYITIVLRDKNIIQERRLWSWKRFPRCWKSIISPTKRAGVKRWMRKHQILDHNKQGLLHRCWRCSPCFLLQLFSALFLLFNDSNGLWSKLRTEAVLNGHRNYACELSSFIVSMSFR